MAYNGGYQEQGRPYAGPAAGRPAPPQPQYPAGSGPQQYNDAQRHPQQYDQYQQDDYGYGYDDGYGGDYDQGYDQGFNQQYDDVNYGRGQPPNHDYPPPQEHYYGPGPRRGGPPTGRGRGAPMGRPPPPGQSRGQYPPRGGAPVPGPGRAGYPPQAGGGRPSNQRHGASDPTGNRRPLMDPLTSGGSGFGGGAFPTFPGKQRKTDLDEERQITGQLAGMDIAGSQRPTTRGRGNMGPPPPRGPPPSGEGYGARPPMDGYGRGAPRPYPPQQDLQEPRRGLPSSQGYGAQSNGGYREENFGPPPRSMTMPARDTGFPPRAESIRPDGAHGGRGMGMQRPSTAQGMRQPPSRDVYPPHRGPQEGYQEPGYAYDQGRDQGYGGPQQRPASLDDFYGYYDDDRTSGDYGPAQAQHHGPLEGGLPQQYDEPTRQQPRTSYNAQTHAPFVQGVPNGGPQRGPGRLPEVSRIKSQPNLRQSQEAIFEMAGDIPPIPLQYQQQTPQQPSQQSGPSQNGPVDYQRGGYAQPGPVPLPAQADGLPSNQGMGYANGQHVRRASLDQMAPQPGPGFPNHPAPYRPGQQPDVQPGARPLHPQASQSTDGLPSHPVPVRVGLAPKPPPVRNYNGGITPAPVPTSAPPVIQAQPAPPQQQQAGGGQPPKPKQPEAPVTVEELERLKTLIKSNPQDQASALSLAKKLVEAADVLVPLLPDPKSRNRSRERYLTDSHKILKKLNSAGNVDAMFFLADCMGRGLFSGGEPDNKEAFMLYQSAAKLGHPQAAYRTAVCCEIGNEEGGGTRKDPLKAIQWYRRAAILKDTPAMYKVGMILLKGLLGQPRDAREAIVWLKRAAERADAENPHALHELGLLYETAEDNGPIVRDPAYAFQLFKQAADLGYKFSQFRLGAAYEYGLMGCPVDARLSIMWYSKAASQAEHQSELALSGWYLTGSEGVLQQSDTEAYLWARKAAQAGLAKAEFAMGYYTEQGIGVPENLEDAKRWYWRAAAQDYPDARKRLEELKRMGKNVPRQRERISRSKMGSKQEGECSVM